MEKYNVVKIMRKSARRVILHKGLSKSEVMRIVQSYPDSNRSMVVFTKQ